MTSELHEEMIDEVLDDFNFERVHCAMTAIDWKWQTTEGKGFAVPTIARLKARARILLRDAIKDKYIATGGLHAQYHPANDTEREWFHLQFVLCEADNCPDD